MALPKAVQAQVDLADQMVAEMNGVPNTDTPPADPVPVDPPAAEVKPDVAPVQPPVVSEETWQQRFNTLQGKYNAEIPRFAAQIRELTQSMQAVMEENNRIREEAKRVPEAKQASPVTDSEREAFGSDLIELQERIARSVVDPLLAENAQLKAQLNELANRVGSVDQQVATTASGRFFDLLGNLVPDWEMWDSDPRFLNWLDTVDPIYNMPRRVGLENAHEAFDVHRVAAIFNTFKGQIAPAPVTPKQELSAQVAPTRTRTAQVTTDGISGKIWTQNEITQFYNDLRRGHLTDAEASRIDQEIQLAAAEGRIR